MKLTKKKVLVSALAISLVAILSLGTLAWFTATDSVTNKFYVATEEDGTPDFSVELTETDYDGSGEKGNTYLAVLPGAEIAKDPTVTNTGDYSEWIRVKVTLNNATFWALGGGSLNFTDVFELTGSEEDYGLAENVGRTGRTWLLVSEEAEVDEYGNGVWYLYLNYALAPDASVKVFNTVKVPENFDMEDVANMGYGFTITVNVDALQSENTGNNAVEAFKNVGWEPGTTFEDID